MTRIKIVFLMILITCIVLTHQNTYGSSNLLHFYCHFSSDPEEFSNRIANMEDKKTRKMKPPVEPIATQEPIQKPSVPGHTGPRSWPPKVNSNVLAFVTRSLIG